MDTDEPLFDPSSFKIASAPRNFFARGKHDHLYKNAVVEIDAQQNKRRRAANQNNIGQSAESEQQQAAPTYRRDAITKKNNISLAPTRGTDLNVGSQRKYKGTSNLLVPENDNHSDNEENEDANHQREEEEEEPIDDDLDDIRNPQQNRRRRRFITDSDEDFDDDDDEDDDDAQEYDDFRKRSQNRRAMKYGVGGVEASAEQSNSKDISLKSIVMFLKKIMFKKPFIPLFIYFVSIVQFIMVVVGYILNGTWEVAPLLDYQESVLVRLGAKHSGLMRADSQLWRLLTVVFVNSGAVHLFLNLSWQLTLGVMFEREMGLFRFAPVYLLSNVAGYMLSAIFLTDRVTAGSTPSLAGVVGCSLANLIINWFNIDKPWRQVFSVLFQLGLLLVLGFTPFGDNFAHAGGFLVGFFVSLIVFPVERSKSKMVGVLTIVFGIVGSLIYFVICVPMFFALVNFKCEGCKYVSPDVTDLFNK